jgi:hypothetical protein
MNKITHEGEINLGNTVVPCYVLEDGRRVLSGRGMQSALKMVDESESQTAGTRLNRYLEQESLKPFLYKESKLDRFKPLDCYKGNTKINGYEATTLIELCDAFLEARNHINLGPRQQIIANQCEILVRSFAKVGLIALIDEATGYQYEREKNELQKIVDMYVAEELRPWQKTFPDVYYREIFRLRGWDFTVTSIRRRPGVVGKWTNQFIYEQLPEGVLEELKTRTPKTDAGNYKARFFQSLTEDAGELHLRNQLNSVITLLQISDTWEEFIEKFKKLVSKRLEGRQLEPEQLKLDFDDFIDEDSNS